MLVFSCITSSLSQVPWKTKKETNRQMVLNISGRLLLQWKSGQSITHTSLRNKGIYTQTGGMRPAPQRLKYPIPRVLCTVLPPLLIGMYVAHNVAYYLDEYDLFSGVDDDD